MKVKGVGFTYWYNLKQLKDYDAWDKIFHSKDNIKTEVRGLEMHIYDKKEKDE